MTDKTLRELQSSLPWTGHYHRDFRSNPQTHKDFAHALLHIHKAGGKLAAIIDDAEHGGHEFGHAEIAKYVADFVICALRMANTCPNGVIDLQRVVEDRIVGKNTELADKAPVLQAAEKAPGGETPWNIWEPPSVAFQLWLNEIRRIGIREFGVPDDADFAPSPKKWRFLFDQKITPRDALMVVRKETPAHGDLRLDVDGFLGKSGHSTESDPTYNHPAGHDI